MGAPRSRKIRMPQDNYHELLMVDKRNEQYITCLCIGTTFQCVDGPFEKEHATGTGAEVGGMNDGSYVHLLQGRRARAEYLRWTVPTTKACWSCTSTNRFVGCEEGSACFWDLFPSLVKIYTKQGLRPDSVEARKVFLKEMESFTSRGPVHKMIVLPGSVPMQTISVHIIHFLGYVHNEGTLFVKCGHIHRF